MMKKLLLILPFFLSFYSFGQFGDENDISKSTAGAWDAKFYDLDGDGLLDILSASAKDNKVSWYKNIGGGNYGKQKIITYKAIGVRLVDACDIDNDGDIDIISASQGDTLVSLFRNGGNGNFNIEEKLISTVISTDIKLADIDNDTYIDIVLSSQSTTQIIWFKNNAGLIDTTQRLISSITSANQIFVDDIDNDGDNDVLCSGTLRWYENLGGGNFNPTFNYIGGTAYVLHMDDMDNDNDLDIIYAKGGTPSVLLWIENMGNGSFGIAKLITNTIYNAPESVYSEDIDGDNLKDVICASFLNNLNKITWYKNLGGGIISASENIITLNNVDFIRSVYAGDMDNDGDMDVLSASEVDSKIAVYENLGLGSFNQQRVVSNLIGNIFSITAGDIDGDNDIDLVSGTSTRVVWFKNQGGGDLDNPNIIMDSLTSGAIASLSDIDNDMDLDVISYSFNGLSWHENNGSGIFGIEHVISSMIQGPRQIYIKDLDSDGDEDIVAIVSSSVLVWYENNGNGTFISADTISSNCNGLSDVHGVDFDHDGDIDIITTDQSSNKIESYENLGNGSFGIKTFITNANSPTCLFIEDLNNDGNKDIIFGDGSSTTGVSWSAGNGNGGFSNGIPITSSAISVLDVHSTDIDGDLDNDIISATDNKIYLHENLGNGIFNPLKHIVISKLGGLLTIRTQCLIASDIDVDGDPDIILGSIADEKLSWVENFNISQFQLSGYTFYDENQNKAIDSIERGLSLTNVNLMTNNVNYYSANGYYIFNTDSGIHTVSYTPYLFWNLTTDSMTYTRTLTSLNQVEDSLNFGFYPDSIVTIIQPDLTGAFPRCNDTINYWVNIQNQGTTLPSGIIHLQLDNSISYISSVIPPDSINGQNIYWHYDSLFFFDSEIINLQVLMPPFTSIGDTLSSYLTVHEVDTFNNIVYTNTDTLDQILVCAYDPNDKSVTPKGEGVEGFITQNQELEYLIRFQNTGNDTAITVMIRDQLDENLDWSTLQPIASSHNMQVWIEQDGEAVFKFENIMLPDSNVDFLGSQGFVKFSIQPDTGLAPLTPIYNTANIYFDFNPAVVTNTVLNTIECYSAPLPVISYNFPYLDAGVTGNYTYQWYLNDTLIVGATNDTLTPFVDGDYTVEVTDSNGCFKISLPYTHTTVGLEEKAQLNTLVYPNPFKESTTILFSKSLNKDYDLLVYNIVGAEVYRFNKIAGNSVEINKNDIGKGMFLTYLIHNQTGERIFIEKLIVQ